MTQTSPTRSGLPVISLETSGIVLPSFSFVPAVGRSALDDVDTDLVLLTKLFRMDVPAALHLREPSIGEMLKLTVREGFNGKKGDTQLLRVPLRNSHGEPGRYILMVGLGQASSYCGRTACNVFATLFEQSLELGVEDITVPFIPNPMTKNSLTHKATAFKLKTVLKQVVEEHGSTGNLRQIRIFCHPAAVRSIVSGLQIEHGTGDACACTVTHRK